MKRAFLTIVAAASLPVTMAAFTPAHAEIPNGCGLVKMRSTTKAFICRLREHSKELRGKTGNLGRCDEKLADAFVRADEKGTCTTTGDIAIATAQVTAAADSVFADLHADTATASELGCVLKKAKLAQSYATCQAAALAKRLAYTYLGLQTDFRDCEDTLDEAFAELEAIEQCPVTGESADVRSSAGGGYGFVPDFEWGATAHGSPASNAPLPHAHLPNNDLSGLYAGDSSFLGADLSGSNLTYATLAYSDLTGANLTGVNLTSASFYSATLVDAVLTGANLTGIREGSATGCPAALPADWECRGGWIFGPSVRIENEDLSGFDLSGLDLSVALFQGTVFNGANLSGASLTNVSARYTHFENANLSGADLTNARLERAKMNGANLAGATLDAADLSGGVTATGLLGCPASLPADWDCVSNTLVGPYAALSGANLAGADLSGTNLLRIDLTNADLSGADFSGANLQAAYLRGADLAGANLSTANLTRVDAAALQNCPASLPAGWACVNKNLVGPVASIAYANLAGADLSGLDLTNAVFHDCDLSDATFAGATLTDVVWSYMTCPDHFQFYGTSSCCDHLIDAPASCTPH